MSIFSKINRIVTLRNGIRNRLVTFGLANASTKLEGCKTALESMTDNTKKTTTSNPIRGTFSSGAMGKVFGKTGEGYCSVNSLVEIPVVNLKSENIKNGVNVGGVVGNAPTVVTGRLLRSVRVDSSYSGTHPVTIYDYSGKLIFSGNSDTNYNANVTFSGDILIIFCYGPRTNYGTGFTEIERGGDCVFGRVTGYTVDLYFHK